MATGKRASRKTDKGTERAPDRPAETGAGPAVLEALYATVLSRKGGDPEASHTARLFARGRAKIAQKVGEEAVEAVIEAMRDDPRKLAEESADLLYHLLVLWADAGVEPREIFAILEKRTGISGIAEKKARKDADPDDP